MQKLLTFFQQNSSTYAIFNDQSFNDRLTNNLVSFEQLVPDVYSGCIYLCQKLPLLFMCGIKAPLSCDAHVVQGLGQHKRWSVHTKLVQ